MSPKRPHTADDRDIYRPKTPPKGLDAVPAEVDFEDLTGRYEGEELEQWRARRAEEHPEVSMTKLEKKHDALAKSFTEFRVEHAEQMGAMTGQVGTLTGAVKGLELVVRQEREKEHVKVTTTMEVDAAKRISDVEVSAAKQLEEIEARKVRRDAALKLLGYAGGIGALVLELLHRAGVL